MTRPLSLPGLSLRWLSLLSLLIPLLACDKIQTQDTFDIQLEASARLPAGEGMAPLAYPGLGALLNVDLATRSEFVDRGYDADDVASLELVEAHVTAVQPPAQTLDFLSDLRVVVDTEGQPAFVAARGPSNASRQVTLETPGGDLSAYLLGRQGVISVQAGPSDYPDVETSLRVSLRFTVQIKE